jgi:hypothetical protein
MPRKQSCLLADVPLPRGAARKPEVRLDLDETDAAGEPQQPAQASSSLLLRFEAVVIAGAVVSAAPAEPQRAIRGALSFDRRSTGRLLQG